MVSIAPATAGCAHRSISFMDTVEDLRMYTLNLATAPRGNRRSFLQTSVLAAATAALSVAGGPAAAAERTSLLVDVGASPLMLPPLPYAQDALAPVISANTVGFHYGKHHKGYYDTIAKLTAGTPMAELTLEQLVVQSAGDTSRATLFNNAAQAWNHNFYWNSLSPRQQTPSGKLAELIQRDFGSLDALRRALATACVGQFGSGWGWLVLEQGHLKVVKTSNADLPFIHGQRPLLTIDVWEHAYYLDVQNRRADYVDAVLAKILNWDFAAQNLSYA
jgi:Fe-Mn family superoxide dismutase